MIQHVRYKGSRPNGFLEDGDTQQQILNLENREHVLKEIETGMSPFMRNQNAYF